VIGAAIMVGRIAATGGIEEGAGAPPDDGKDPAAVLLGRKGGRARAAGMTAKRRKEIAKKAATTRWKGVTRFRWSSLSGCLSAGDS
jgi:hypothetical protein